MEMDTQLLYRGIAGSMLGLLLWAGCGSPVAQSEDGEYSRDNQELLVRMTIESYIDSALFFFFRTVDGRDSLFYRQYVYDVTYAKPKDFYFHIPAGLYRVYVWGNLPVDHYTARPPYAPEDIFIDYSRGEEPPGLYLGASTLDVGVDTLNFSGLMIMTSSVSLDIGKIPEGVKQIRASLSNNVAGVYVNGEYSKKRTDPPLAKTLSNLSADSSYRMHFFCFPGVWDTSIEKSVLSVVCYDESGQIVYSGSSAPFEARPGMNYNIGCSFGKSAPASCKIFGPKNTVYLEKRGL